MKMFMYGFLFISFNVFSNTYCPEKISCHQRYGCDVPGSWHSTFLSNIKEGTYSFSYAELTIHPQLTFYKIPVCTYTHGKESTLIIVSDLLKTEPDLNRIGNRWRVESEFLKSYKCIAGENNAYYCPFK